MVENFDKAIKMYADKNCTMQIEKIQFPTQIIEKLVTGEEKVFENVAKAGDEVSVDVFLRNEGRYLYIIKSISYPDKRIRFKFSSGMIEPMQVVKLTVTYSIPSVVGPEDVLKINQIEINGGFIFN